MKFSGFPRFDKILLPWGQGNKLNILCEIALYKVLQYIMQVWYVVSYRKLMLTVKYNIHLGISTHACIVIDVHYQGRP